MPAYTFQERFVPAVLDGTKPHTIRRRRVKGFAKPGDTLYLYYGLRTKQCRKLREEKCTDATSIIITAKSVYLCLGLLPSEKIEAYNRLALRNEDALLDNKRIYEDYLGKPCKFIKLSLRTMNRLAWIDGFRPNGSSLASPGAAWAMMKTFWATTHALPFVGDIIWWTPSNPAK